MYLTRGNDDVYDKNIKRGGSSIVIHSKHQKLIILLLVHITYNLIKLILEIQIRYSLKMQGQGPPQQTHQSQFSEQLWPRQAPVNDLFESSQSLFETSDQLDSGHYQDELEWAKISGLQSVIKEDQHKTLVVDGYIDKERLNFMINLLITLQEAIRRRFYFKYTEQDLYVSKTPEKDGYYVIIKHNNKADSNIQNLTEMTQQILQRWFPKMFPQQETVEQMLQAVLNKVFLSKNDSRWISLRDLITDGIIKFNNILFNKDLISGKGAFQARILDPQNPDNLNYTFKKLESTVDGQTRGVMDFIYLMELIGKRDDQNKSVKSPLYEYIRFNDQVIMLYKVYAENLLDLKLGKEDVHFEKKSIGIFLQILEFLSVLISNNCIPFEINPDKIFFSRSKDDKVFIIFDFFCQQFSKRGIQMQSDQTHKKVQVAATSYNTTNHYEADLQDNIHQLGVTFMVFLLQKYKVSDTPAKTTLIQEFEQLLKENRICQELKEIVMSMVEDEKQKRPNIENLKKSLRGILEKKDLK